MKKIFTFALIALVGIGAKAQKALPLPANLVVYTTNDKDHVVDDALLKSAFTATGLPWESATVANTGLFKLQESYEDAQTGFKIDKGTYHAKRVANQAYFKDDNFPAGISNVKQVVFYLIMGWQVQTSIFISDGQGGDYTANRISSDSNYKFNYSDPGYSNVDGESDPMSPTGGDPLPVSSCSKIFKYVYDLTNTVAPTVANNAEKIVVEEKDNETVLHYVFFDKSGSYTDAEPGPQVTWTKDLTFCIGDGKKGGHMVGIAFICGDENASTMYMNVSDGTNAQWGENKGAYGSPLSTSGISSITTKETKGNGTMYNLAGQRISAPVSGQIYIQNGKKYIKK